jgi:hypothetical protein
MERDCAEGSPFGQFVTGLEHYHSTQETGGRSLHRTKRMEDCNLQELGIAN